MFTLTSFPGAQLKLLPQGDWRENCGICEKDSQNDNEAVVYPAHFAARTHSDCFKSVEKAHEKFFALIKVLSSNDLAQLRAIQAGLTAVRLAAGMPISQFLKQNGEAALKKLYDQKGIPAAAKEIGPHASL